MCWVFNTVWKKKIRSTFDLQRKRDTVKGETFKWYCSYLSAIATAVRLRLTKCQINTTLTNTHHVTSNFTNAKECGYTFTWTVFFNTFRYTLTRPFVMGFFLVKWQNDELSHWTTYILHVQIVPPSLVTTIFRLLMRSENSMNAYSWWNYNKINHQAILFTFIFFFVLRCFVLTQEEHGTNIINVKKIILNSFFEMKEKPYFDVLALRGFY